jgi:hypothetical protein
MDKTALEALQIQSTIASLTSKHKTSHVLHLLVSIVTFGWWIPVWILVGISNMNEKMKLEKKIQQALFNSKNPA